MEWFFTGRRYFTRERAAVLSEGVNGEWMVSEGAWRGEVMLGEEYHARTEEGRRALQERPRVGPLELEVLGRLPENTLGRTLAEAMQRMNLDPSAIPTLSADNDGEYVFAHYYETHDIWHAVTGFGVDKAGELGLQAFYLAQGPARLSAMILSAGLLELVVGEEQFDDRERRLTEIVRGYEMGRRATSLFGVRWNEMWNVPLSDVRSRFRLL